MNIKGHFKTRLNIFQKPKMDQLITQKRIKINRLEECRKSIENTDKYLKKNLNKKSTISPIISIII